MIMENPYREELWPDDGSNGMRHKQAEIVSELAGVCRDLLSRGPRISFDRWCEIDQLIA